MDERNKELLKGTVKGLTELCESEKGIERIRVEEGYDTDYDYRTIQIAIEYTD
ncbi:hypothetical protein [Marinilactibacillus sp. 15R]|uniref:hypothetical protein n=1 Tax=Marinilactibacillus sp. 15R TaxID=1911586 RepID=UPI0012EB5489|nr:hypothetical protein [Marinilactibacillus sp. 15R]